MADPHKSAFLSSQVHRYLVDHGTPPDPLLAELIDETRREVGPMALMQVAPEQGAFLTLFTRLLGVRRRDGQQQNNHHAGRQQRDFQATEGLHQSSSARPSGWQS